LVKKAKFASLVARQAALTARICTGSMWELAANLVYDRKETNTGRTLRHILLEIPSTAFPNKPLFHTVEGLRKSQTGITFIFLPKK
jgi:hypothetical protein